jgi:hypothetical protein
MGAILFLKDWRRNYMAPVLLFALLPSMLFDHWLWSLHFGLLFLAVIAGLVVGFFREERI